MRSEMKKNLQLKKIYNNVFKKQDRVRETEEFKEVLKLVRWKNKEILDVGCGTGKLAYLISKKGGNVKGVDYSKSAIEIAKRKYQNPNLKYELIDVSKKILGKYDVIISVGTLEHMDNPYFLLKKLKNNLKPGGKIVITSPNWANTRGFILMTLYFLLEAPITLADLHYLTPIDFMSWSKKLKLNLTWKTIEYSWGSNKKLIQDLSERLPKIFQDTGLQIRRENVKNLLNWLNYKVIPLENTSKLRGAIGVYIFSNRK